MTNRLETCAREQGIIPGGEKSHQCDYCNYASSSQKNLRTHVFFYHFDSLVSGLVNRLVPNL